MANTLTAVVPKLLAQGLRALRQNSITPRLVNRKYEQDPGTQGTTIDVPIPSSITAVAVTPAATPPSTADIAPTSVAVALDQWKEAPFYLTDKEKTEIMNGVLPMQASEAVKAIANDVDNYLLGLYPAFYGYHGTAGTTPFGSTPGVLDGTNAMKVLNEQLAPRGDRHVMLDAAAEAQALGLREFADVNFSGSIQAIVEGNLNYKLGANWWMNQNIPTHTAGTASAAGVTLAVDDGSGVAAGLKTVTMDVAASTATIVAGDILSFANHSQTYTVTTGGTVNTTGIAISFEPALQAAVVDDEAVTVRKSHVVNLAFHRDAIAFATKPLASTIDPRLGLALSQVDPISGLALRLEVSREHKRDRYSFDILYGAQVVRRELGMRLAG